MSLMRFVAASGQVESLYTDEHFNAFWTNDHVWRGHQLFTLRESSRVVHLMGINIDTHDIIWLSPQGDLTMDAIAVLDHDNVLVTTTMQRNFASLARFCPDTRECSFLLEETWDQRAVLTGDRLIVVENQAGCDVVRLFAWPEMREIECGLPPGVCGEIDINGHVASVDWQSPCDPPQTLRFDVGNGTMLSQHETRFTPTPVRFVSDDGEPLWAWHYTPQTEPPWPTILWLHDGPQSQERTIFRPLFQWLLSCGFAIFAPNLRGSTGFGARYAKTVEGACGEAEIFDLRAAVRWVRGQGSASHLAVMGESYGGYLALRAAQEMPDAFAAAIDLFGFCNLNKMIETAPIIDRAELARVVGNHPPSITQVGCPLLVIAGRHDARVSVQEIDALLSRAPHAESLVFDDEAHGFTRRANAISAAESIASFLYRHFTTLQNEEPSRRQRLE